VAAGRTVVVANRTHERAESFAAEHGIAAVAVSEVLAVADVCVTSLPDGPALEELVSADGLLAASARAGTVLIDMSTIDPETSARVADCAAAAGIEFLRAPVSGNPAVVDAGNLAIMVSGPEEVFERLRPLLADIGPTLFYLGAGEQARVMKLALNLMLVGTTELLAEAVLLGEANDLPRDRALDVISNTVVASPFIKYKAPALAARDYTPTATTELLAKDIRLALALASGSRLPLPATELVGRLLDETVDLGHGEQDFLALALRLEHVAAGAAAPIT
jgi:3-hydroxyisobutyrate dehydrogenase-like beta-hydroxyacid dehydrogenase